MAQKNKCHKVPVWALAGGQIICWPFESGFFEIYASPREVSLPGGWILILSSENVDQLWEIGISSELSILDRWDVYSDLKDTALVWHLWQGRKTQNVWWVRSTSLNRVMIVWMKMVMKMTENILYHDFFNSYLLLWVSYLLKKTTKSRFSIEL